MGSQMATSWELYRVSVLPDLQRDTSGRQLWPLTPVTIHWKKSVPNISRYIGHGKKLILRPRDPKHHHGPSVTVRAFEGQAKNPGLDPPVHSESACLSTHLIFPSPAPGLMMGMDMTYPEAVLIPHCFLGLWDKNYCSECLDFPGLP